MKNDRKREEGFLPEYESGTNRMVSVKENLSPARNQSILIGLILSNFQQNFYFSGKDSKSD